MNAIQKTLVILAVLLIAIAAYISTTKQVETDANIQKELLKKAVEVGKNKSNYLYSYRETYDSYATEYSLLQKNGERMIEIHNPLSVKQVYFLKEDTILCTEFMNKKSCSSVKNNTRADLNNYLLSLQSKFFNDAEIERENARLNYFMERGYLKISPHIINKTINGRECSEISYTMDFTNMTISEANAYGISPGAPKYFEWSLCVDNSSGLSYSKHFNYSFQGKGHTWDFVLLAADWNPKEDIVPPENLTERLAYDILLEEMEWQNEFRVCYQKTGDEKDKCFSDIALQLKMKSICELAGGRRDQCFVRLVPLTGDDSICNIITNPSFKEDCYIELAGLKKDNSYCSMIANITKQEFCMNISVQTNQATIPNPAAVNCERKGYSYEIRSNESGQYGVCIYEDRECDEWALYREECCLTNEDCSSGTCEDGVCIGRNDTNISEGNGGRNNSHIQQFLGYIDKYESSLINETSRTTGE